MAIQDYLGDINAYMSPYQGSVESAYGDLARVSGDSATLPFKLKDAVNKKLNYNADLIGQTNEAMAQYVAAPAQARNQYQNVWNPFQREALVAGDRAQKMKQWSTYNDLLGQRMGDVKDLVGEGVAGWQGVVNQAQALSQLALQKYQNAWNEYTQAAKMQQAADEAAAYQQRWEKEFGLSREQFEWQKSKGSGGGGGTGIPGVSKANQETSAMWDQYVAQAEELYGDNPLAAADYVYALIQRDDASLRNTGINVDRLYEYQGVWRDQILSSQPAADQNTGGSWWNTVTNWFNRGNEPYNPAATAVPTNNTMFYYNPGQGFTSGYNPYDTAGKTPSNIPFPGR